MQRLARLKIELGQGDRGDWLAAAVLLVEVLVFHGRVLFSRSWTFPWDLRDYHLPLAEFMARCLRQGALPLWDPYTYCGMPFYANVQTQFAYPPAWITILLSNWTGGRHLLEFLEWQIVLHVFLAGIFTYWLLRRIGAGRMSATFGATIFQLGGYFASQTQHLGAMNAAAWLPLTWLAVVELARSPRLRWAAVLAVALALSFAAGFPAVTIVVFVSAGGLAAALWLFGAGSARAVLAVGMASLWAVWLSAVQLLPALELAGHSTAYRRGEFAGTGGGVPLLALVSLAHPNHHHIFDLEHYKLPWNPTFLYLYCGLAALLLAPVGLLGGRSRYRLPLLAVLAGGALWMLGESTPVGRTMFAVLPTTVRSPLYAEFAMPVFQLALAALAGLGAERVAAQCPWAAALLVALTAADLTLAGSRRLMNAFPVAQDPAVALEHFEGSAETLQRVRAWVQRTTPPARLEGYRDSMRWANSAPMIEIATASGNDPLAPERILLVRRLFGQSQPWLRYWELADLDSPLPSLLNVGYLITWAPSDQPVLQHPRWLRVADLPGHQLYQNKTVLPRFFLVGRVVPAESLRDALGRMASPEFDPRREAIVEGPASALDSEASGQVRVIEYGLRRVVLETHADGRAFLVSSETYYPGWRAWIDGKPSQLRLTNVAFRGLSVPAGRHRVEMEFRPAILGYGLILSLCAAVSIVVALARDRARQTVAARSTPIASTTGFAPP